MTKNPDEPIDEARACSLSDGGQLASSASWPHDDETDDGYNDLLASIGRTEEQDQRIAVHEAGHAVAARLLGRQVGGVTINPAADGGFEGLCWGVGYTEAFAQGRGDASDVREALAPLMPEPGEDRRGVADIFGHVRDQCIEFLAGRAAERIVLDGEPIAPVDDLRQARELALLICSSESAIDTLIAHCDVAARDLLMPYGDVVMALSILLRVKRTLDGAEIDALISDVQARKARAIELARRADCKRRELSARTFLAEIKSRE
ncbi:hypothetical protein [Bradyrhizobium australiense]|uniref:Peptidase M41 domain-containing protein n=1 Tax=Bradyrhizobium australiense TaxID=2721161 RepID=A0A7Y4GQW0_9BRAD|nr:hypothetical protein [Bradyrhizobium australiense]NOJ40323.1 hypothetical protein [Bradyrhizobium australiense]